MGGQDRGSSADLNAKLKLELKREAHTFSFYQVMRLLRRFSLETPQSVASRTPAAAQIRVAPKLSLAFPAADVESVTEQVVDETVRYEVTANFLGLYGISSPLPTFYTEDLMDEAADDESAARDFVDLINHELFCLLFECWLKYRQHLQVVEEENSKAQDRLFCLMGLGERVWRKDIRQPYRLLRYVGLLTQLPRSASGLETLLCDALDGFPVRVIPCVSRTAKIPLDQRLLLGGTVGYLGTDSFIGEEIEDRMGKFRIRVGPLDQEQFRLLLPGTEAHVRLFSLTRLYILEALEYEVEVVLAALQAQKIRLGAPTWSRLGLDTWLFSTETLGEVRAVFHTQ
jgi:type VI secretion system protein ImpH